MFSHRYHQQHLHSSCVLYHHHHLASVWRGLFFPHGCTLISCANVLPAHKTTQNRYHFVSFWCLLKLSLCVWIFFSLIFILLPFGWYCFRFIRVQYAEPLILVMGLKQMAFVTVGFALLADCLLLMWFFFRCFRLCRVKIPNRYRTTNASYQSYPCASFCRSEGELFLLSVKEKINGSK